MDTGKLITSAALALLTIGSFAYIAHEVGWEIVFMLIGLAILLAVIHTAINYVFGKYD